MPSWNWEQDRDDEIERVVGERDISEVIAVAVEAMITGAVDGLLVNLGHTVSCDPALSSDYGRRLLCRAIDELKAAKAGGDDDAELHERA